MKVYIFSVEILLRYYDISINSVRVSIPAPDVFVARRILDEKVLRSDFGYDVILLNPD